MEMETYRYSGHSMSDPGTSYRSREEVQAVRQTRDPIISFKDKILKNKLATAEQLKAIDAKVRKDVDEGTHVAKTEKEIGIEELTGDIYYTNLEKNVRGVHPESLWPHLNVAPRQKVA